MVRYVGIIWKLKDGTYAAEVRDIPALVGIGKTEEEAKADFMKYFPDHLNGRKEDGLPLPPPRSFAELVSEPEQDAREMDEDFGEPKEWPVEVMCPLLSGPKSLLIWIMKETLNAVQETQAGRDYWQAT